MNTAHPEGTHAVCQVFFRLVFVFPDAVSASLSSVFPHLSARPRAGRTGVAVSRIRFDSSLRPARAPGAPPPLLALGHGRRVRLQRLGSVGQRRGRIRDDDGTEEHAPGRRPPGPRSFTSRPHARGEGKDVPRRGNHGRVPSTTPAGPRGPSRISLLLPGAVYR